VAPLIGLGLPVLLGMAALSMDVGQWLNEKRTLQTAADAAAVGAATELTNGRSDTMTTQAQKDSSRNGVPVVTGTTLTLNSPPISGAHAGDASAVEVIITRQEHRTFSGSLFGIDPIARARAVALIGDAGKYCVLGLKEVNVAVLISGSTDVNLDCGVAANADLKMNGNKSALSATSATISGTVTGFSQNLDVPADATQVQAPITKDPYSDLPVPSPLPGSGSVSGSNPKTYSPGTFNSTIQVSSNTVFQPGVYVMNNASLKITAGQVTGTGVTFIFTGTSPASIGGLDISSNQTTDLTAPTSGPYKGVAFYQSANADPTAIVNKINGTSNVHLTGAVYFPNQEVDFQGDNTTGGSNGGCTQVVASKVTFTGNSKLGYDCDGTGVRPINSSRVALVE